MGRTSRRVAVAFISILVVAAALCAVPGGLYALAWAGGIAAQGGLGNVLAGMLWGAFALAILCLVFAVFVGAPNAIGRAWRDAA